MQVPALARLQVLLEQRGVVLPVTLESRAQAPVRALERLETDLTQVTVALDQAKARRTRAQARVASLAAASPTQRAALVRASGQSEVELSTLALQELDTATAHEQGLGDLQAELQARLHAALTAHAAASEAFRARWQQSRRISTSIGPSKGLGREVETTLGQALDQVLDQVLVAEQRSGRPLWPLKDRVDALYEACLGLATLPSPEGEARVLEILRELETISAAVTRPGRHQRDGQEEHNKAAE